MSTVIGPTRTGTARPGTGTVRTVRPRLRVVDDPQFRPPRVPFVLFVVVLLVAGLVGLLLLNTELQRGTFHVTALNKQAQQLRDQQEDLEHQVRTLEAPQNLANRALRLGMVPNPNPVFLRLSDGKVLGVPAKGKAGSGATVFGPALPKPKPPVVQPTVKPTAQSTVKPGTKPSVKPGTKPSVKPSVAPRQTSPPAQRTRAPARSTKPNQTAEPPEPATRSGG